MRDVQAEEPGAGPMAGQDRRGLVVSRRSRRQASRTCSRSVGPADLASVFTRSPPGAPDPAWPTLSHSPRTIDDDPATDGKEAAAGVRATGGLILDATRDAAGRGQPQVRNVT